MADVSVVIEVKCGACGEWLKSTGEQVRDGIEVIATPCAKCLNKANDEGHEQGYNERDQEEA